MIKIAVLLGTQPYKFTRIISYLNKINIEAKFFIQANFHITAKFDYQLINSSEYDEIIRKADICIVHGGAGTIFRCLELDKKIIIFPRLAKFNEHIDDHQLELTQKVASENWAIEATEDINSDIKIINKKLINKYINNFEKDTFCL